MFCACTSSVYQASPRVRDLRMKLIQMDESASEGSGLTLLLVQQKHNFADEQNCVSVVSACLLKLGKIKPACVLSMKLVAITVI